MFKGPPLGAVQSRLMCPSQSQPPSIFPISANKLTELSTRVALHRLRLTVARKVIRPTALVTRRRAAPPSSRKPAAEPASEAAARRTRCAASHAWGRAVARKMAAETAGVAATACAGAAEAESRAVGLHVAEALAVVALFGWCEC